jgi:pimeloyl-ACP methyl ester carboxylesterase
LADIVLAELPESEPWVLLAESFSGPIALRVAARHRNPPVAVILCASFVQCPLPRILIAALRFCGIAMFGTRPPGWLVGRYLLGEADEEVMALFYRAIDKVSPRVLAQRFSVLLEFDERFAPPVLKCPLLYLQASRDRVIKPRNFEIIQRRYPETQLQRIESPHLLLQVQPAAAVLAILQFLAGLRTGAP